MAESEAQAVTVGKMAGVKYESYLNKFVSRRYLNFGRVWES